MLNSEIAQQIQRIELIVKKMMSGVRTGDVHSKIKGIGFEFSQIREYQQGDDVRFIDWKSSARMQKMLIKECYEERNKVIALLVDVTASQFYGSKKETKHSMITQLSCAISLAGLLHKDAITVVLVSDEESVIVPPQSDRLAVMKMLERLYNMKPNRKSLSSLSSTMSHMVKQLKKNALLFVLSDFFDDSWYSEMKKVASIYDVIAIRCLDINEVHIPHVSGIELQDIESDEKNCFTTATLNRLGVEIAERYIEQKKVFEGHGISCLDVYSSEHYIEKVIHFLKTRLQKR